MVRSILFIVLLSFYYNLQSQELKWIYKIGGTATESGNGLAIDSDQNIYDIASITGTVSVVPNVTYTSRGEEDILVRKSTSLGILQWVRQISSKNQDIANDIATDLDGNIFVVGTYIDSLFLGTQFILEGSPDRVQSFVLKLSTSGTLLWVQRLHSSGSVTAKSVTAGLTEELVISGNFEGNATFGTGFPGFSEGGNDIFVLKMNGNSGDPLFIRRIGGTDHEFAYQHTRDNLGNIYVTGDFRNTLDLDPGAGEKIVNTNGLTDAYLVKLTTNGNFIWGKTFGGVGVDYGQSVATDDQRNIIITGRYSDNVNFGGNSHIFQSKGGTDIYLVKMNESGDIQWANSFGDVQNDQGNQVIINKNNIIYLGGIFRGTVDFDPSIAFNNQSVSDGGADGFIALFNQDGSYNEHFTLGGIANDQLNDLVLKNNGELISTGGFGAIADFDPGLTEVNIFSNGGLDAFLWNTFVCVNPYLKAFHAEKTELCFGEKVFIQIDEGYLNDATQWSWQRDSCSSITFASGDFLNVDVEENTTFFIKGFGNCVVNDICKKIDISVFKDSLIYQSLNLCDGDTILVGTSKYTTAGVFVDSLQSASGCDSVVVTELFMYPKFVRTQSQQICDGDTVRVGSFNYTVAGTFTTHLQSINGCDSTIITTITILPSKIENAEGIICKGDFITIGNVTYSKSGTFIQTSTGENGCEDILIVNIKVLEIDFLNKVNLCAGDSIQVGNNIYKTSGVFRDELVSSFGCDSNITTTVTVLPHTSYYQEVSLCDGDSIKVGDKTYKTTGNYIDTLSNFFGCDSIVTSDVRVYSIPDTTFQSIMICEGDSLVVGTQNYKVSGIFTDRLMTNVGCDSIVVSDLLVFEKSFFRQAIICKGDSVIVGDSTFFDAGIHIVSLTNYFGCDSIIMLDLMVNEIVTQEFTYIICPSDTIFVGNHQYTNAGNYIDTLVAVTGCDSIVKSNIKLNHVTTNLAFDLCVGEAVGVNNISYNESGIFTDTLIKSDGCDSILQIKITVFPKYVKDTIFEICKGGSVTIGTSTYFNAGRYSELLSSKYGCDSLVTFEIRIVNFVPIFSSIRDTLTAFKIEGAQYQWFECINDEKVPYLGATQNKFALFKSGIYSLSVTYKGCTYFSDCIPFILSSAVENYNSDKINYYPNPVVDVLYFSSENKGVLSIKNITGQVIFQNNIIEGANQVNTSMMTSGTYVMQFSTNGRVYQYQLIKL